MVWTDKWIMLRLRHDLARTHISPDAALVAHLIVSAHVLHIQALDPASPPFRIRVDL